MHYLSKNSHCCPFLKNSDHWFPVQGQHHHRLSMANSLFQQGHYFPLLSCSFSATLKGSHFLQDLVLALTVPYCTQ